VLELGERLERDDALVVRRREVLVDEGRVGRRAVAELEVVRLAVLDDVDVRLGDAELPDEGALAQVPPVDDVDADGARAVEVDEEVPREERVAVREAALGRVALAVLGLEVRDRVAVGPHLVAGVAPPALLGGGRVGRLGEERRVVGHAGRAGVGRRRGRERGREVERRVGRGGAQVERGRVGEHDVEPGLALRVNRAVSLSRVSEKARKADAQGPSSTGSRWASLRTDLLRQRTPQRERESSRTNPYRRDEAVKKAASASAV